MVGRGGKKGLGFGVWGLRYGVWGLGVHGFKGSRVLGLGFLGCRNPSVGALLGPLGRLYLQP